MWEVDKNVSGTLRHEILETKENNYMGVEALQP
jgi:hypothetical protein